MKIECGARLESVAIGAANLACSTVECPLQKPRLLFMDDKSGLLSPAEQRASLERRADVIAKMVCVANPEERQKPAYAPLFTNASATPKR